MAITQLTDGGEVPIPAKRMRVGLVCSANAQLNVVDSENVGVSVPPVARISATELIIDARDGIALVVAPATGLAFPDGATAELTITGAGAAPDVVRRTATVGGRRQVVLASMADGGLRSDGDMSGPTEGSQPIEHQSWHTPGRDAYYRGERRDTGGGRHWAAVVDCSASMLAPTRQQQLHDLLQLVLGGAVAASRTRPVSVLAPSGSGLRETAALLETPEVDWPQVLGSVPSPWPRLTPAVRQAAASVGSEGFVVIVCDGAPADSEELTRFAGEGPHPKLHVLALGRSPYEAMATARPTEWWDDELDALSGLTGNGHVLVSLQRTDVEQIDSGRLIAALFPETAG